MTLAAILLLTLFCLPAIGPTPLAFFQTDQSPPAQEKSAGTTQDQTNSAPPAKTPAAKKTSPAPKKPAATLPKSAAAKPGQPAKGQPASHLRRRLPNLNVDCNAKPSATATDPKSAQPTTPSNSQPNSNSALDTSASKTSLTSNTSPASAGKSGTAAPSSNCPPAKIVIQQGGTTEPSIQLVGGGATGAQASDDRKTATQMLQSTEVNLKKAQGTQLDSGQQEMVRQVRQFVDQSKAATTAGDLDRARTLAWKAELLSEELVRPQK